MKPRRSSKFPLVAGVLLLVVVVAGFFMAYQSVKDEGTVVVAAKDLPAFRPVTDGDIEYRKVPRASITEHDLTQTEYEEQYGTDTPFVPTAQVLAGNRIDDRNAAKNPKASFAIISPDERVVAVTATLSGAAVGTIRAGNIVDVTQAGSSASGGGAAANFAKVICISDKVDGCKNVIAPGLSVSAETKEGNREEPVNVLLAVADEDAPALAGQAVALALNPFCEVGEDGMFRERAGSPVPCQIDPDEMDRDAATGVQAAGDSANTASKTEKAGE